MNQVAENPALRKRFGAAERKRLKAHLSWKAMAEQTLDIYVNAIHRISDVGADPQHAVHFTLGRGPSGADLSLSVPWIAFRKQVRLGGIEQRP